MCGSWSRRCSSSTSADDHPGVWYRKTKGRHSTPSALPSTRDIFRTEGGDSTGKIPYA